MQIRRWMTSPVRSVKPLDSVEHVRTVLEDLRINQLPVTVNEKIVGIITDRDVRDATPSVFEFSGHEDEELPVDPKNVTVESVMTHSPITLGPKDSVNDAAVLMRRERIGAIPVTEGDQLVGILTRSDLLDALVSFTESA